MSKFARRIAMQPGAYQVVAEGVRRIPDPLVRQNIADHFAAYFAGRSPSFDPQQWFEATGGLINRRSAA